MWRLLPCLALAAGVVPTMQAQAATTVYRCGPDGRTFSQAPCEGVATERGDAPSSNEQRAARAAAQADQALADRLERERLARQARETPAGAGHIGHTLRTEAQASDSTLPKHRKTSKPRRHKVDGDDFKAVVPAPAKG
jgi:hypothetical protein